MAYAPIHIKASEKGSLHRLLHVPQDQPIPASKEAVKPGDSRALKKKKQFALNAKGFNHMGGLSKLMGS